MKKYIDWEKLSNIAYTCNHCKKARFEFTTCVSQKDCPIWKNLEGKKMKLNKKQLNELADYVMAASEEMNNLVFAFEMFEKELGCDDPVFRYEQSILLGNSSLQNLMARIKIQLNCIDDISGDPK